MTTTRKKQRIGVRTNRPTAKRSLKASTYRSRVRLLTAGETRFYTEGLVPAINGRWHVSFKPRLADVIGVRSLRSLAGRKVAQKHLDFVVTTKGEARILLAIELDDATHDHPQRRSRDAFVDQALRDAGIPLLRIPVFRKYLPDVIANHIHDALAKSRQRGRRSY